MQFPAHDMYALRDVLPKTAMASVASCFEIAGHQVTDALAEEIWKGQGSSITFDGGRSTEIDRVWHTKNEKDRFFTVKIILDLGEDVAKHSRYMYYMWERFDINRQGVINMMHHTRKCRQQIERGICTRCEEEPRPKRLHMSTGQCTLCFLAEGMGLEAA